MKAKLIKNREEYVLSLDKGTYKEVIGHSFDAGKHMLSKQNCEEEFAKAMGVVDVEKLAMDWRESTDYNDADSYSYILGFNKAMELNKDKVFTLEDMKRAFSRGKDLTAEERFKFTEWEAFTKLVDSIQPTEIEVEIVMKNSRTGKIIKSESDLEWDEDGVCDRAVPKLNSEGCLILKKK
jgi:hypothetical protein